MADWKHAIDIKDVWQRAKNGEAELPEVAHTIVGELEKLPVKDDDDLLNIIDQFQDVDADTDVDDFDGIMSELYDWGDTTLDSSKWPHVKRCWIGTI